jgi:rhamnosyltransferase
MLQGLAGVEFIANGENLGVARALNMGAKLALERGIDYLLTMDQDSRATPGMVRAMLFSLAEREMDNIGIMAPDLVTKPVDIAPTTGICHEVGTVMTSGSLLDLRAYVKVGPFLDELFIDFIDIEYCLRLRAAGFRIVRGGGAVLEHRVGEIIKIPLGARGFHLTSHSPIRKYYKTRNRFYVADRYRDIFPFFRLRDMARFLLELVRLLIFEEEKLEKLRMMGKGYRDYRKGRLGKYASSGAITCG